MDDPEAHAWWVASFQEALTEGITVEELASFLETTPEVLRSSLVTGVCPSHGVFMLLSSYLRKRATDGLGWDTAKRTGETIREFLQEGDPHSAYRFLSQAQNLLVAHAPEDRARWGRDAPSIGTHEWDLLFAAWTARTCDRAGLPPFPWTEDLTPLEHPWSPFTRKQDPEGPLAFLGIYLRARDLEVRGIDHT